MWLIWQNPRPCWPQAAPCCASIMPMQRALQRLPGVGPVLAQRIIEWREVNGPFASMVDLDKVDGVGPALLRDLEALLRFD